MNRTTLATTVVLTTVLLSTAGAVSAAEGKADKPNLLFIAVDDLRPQLGCYGKSWMKTPNIDRLAASGMTFSRHYVQVATCGASRHALLTGLRPAGKYDYTNQPFQRNQREIANRKIESFVHLFRQNGYHTAAIGKISHRAFLGNKTDLPRSWSEVPDPARALKNAGVPPKGFVKPSRKGRIPFEAGEVDDNGYRDGVIAEMAIASLRKFEGKPFVLGVGFAKPHLPFNSPKKYWDLYEPEKIPHIPFPEVPKGINPEQSLHPSFELVGQYHVPEGALDDAAYISNLRHGYCAAVSYIDAQIGKVLNELDRLGLSKNTIVVLWGDHGWHLGDLGTWGKHTGFERGVRSPLLVRVPGTKHAGIVNDALIESVDIYPTLADLFELPAPDGLGGDSFISLLKDPNEKGPDEAFSYHRPWGFPKDIDNRNPKGPWAKTMRTDRYRFTRWTTEIDSGELVRTELYDHQTDPEESNNIARQKPEIVKALMARINNDRK